MLSKYEIKAYLNRLGIPDIEEPTQEYLFALHKAHVSRVPWQTLDIYTGRPASIDVKETVQLISGDRSGYCFQLNGAFGTLLRSLGYEVSWHRAGVQPQGQEPRINSFHLGMTVKLTNAQGQMKDWVIDVGLGDMPYEPIPLQHGAYTIGPFTYLLKPSDIAEGGWRMEHETVYSYIGVDIAPETEATLDVFVPKHAYYSTSPESPWIQTFLMRQRDDEALNEIRGCMWKQWTARGLHTVELTRSSDWFDVLASIFHEKLVRYTPIERQELWNRVQMQHEAWKRVEEAKAGTIS